MQESLASADVRGPRLSAGLALALLAALCGAILVGWLGLAVGRGVTFALDENLRAAVHTYASPGLTRFMRGATDLGGVVALTVGTLAATAAFLAAGWRRAAVLLPLTMIGAAVLDLTLKAVVERPRPEPFFSTPVPASFSFPSGHALDSFCFYLTLAVLVAARVRGRGVKAALILAALALAFLIGLSRIYLGVHWPTDVLAGYTSGLVWILAVAGADRLLRARRG